MLDNIINKIFNRKKPIESYSSIPIVEIDNKDFKVSENDESFNIEDALHNLSKIGLINIYKSCDSPYWNISLESLPQSKTKLFKPYEDLKIKVKGLTIKEALESLNDKVVWVTKIGLIDEQ